MASPLVIHGAQVIDGVGNPPLADHTVVLDGNTIREVLPADDVDLEHFGPHRLVDARNRTVMPGLIDAHCHMTYGESFAQEEQDLYTGVESRTLRAAWNIQRVLRAGVTSISQPGGSYYIGCALRDAIAAGRLQGPRVYTAGRYLSTSNGLTDFYPDSVGNPDGAIGVLTNTLPEMIAEVRHQVKNNVDFIKLADSPVGEHQAFMPDEIAAITALAHQLGREVTIHARGNAEVRAAIAAGVDWIMHANYMDDDTATLLAESGIPLVPTLLLVANWADHGHLAGVREDYQRGAQRMLEATRQSLHRAVEAGVTLVAGTDTGFAVTPYGEWHARELQLLVEYGGLDNIQAIQAGTSNAAVTVGLAGRVGAVRPGMLADLLIVDGNPAKDLAVLLDWSRLTVIKDGQIQEFTPLVEERSWPNDRSRQVSTGYLTQALVAEAYESSRR